MLLTLTSTSPPATDLGFLLHKNPASVRSVSMNWGTAHVFYPAAQADRCTAAPPGRTRAPSPSSLIQNGPDRKSVV